MGEKSKKKYGGGGVVEINTNKFGEKILRKNLFGDKIDI
jgi:hypothetical protein